MEKPNRLVEVLDAVLNGGTVHLSRFHRDRLIKSGSGEAPGRLLASLVGRKEAWGAMFAGLDIPAESGDPMRFERSARPSRL